MQVLNDPWPWWGTLRGRPMSVADLVAHQTLTPDTAAVLWWAINHGCSVFVAAGPPGAGKSTVANALLEFLPHDAHVYVTAGSHDPLDIPPTDGPIYLLINELSAHMPVYVYGRTAQRSFALLDEGVRIVGTLHARSGAEALRVMRYAADLDRDSLTTPFMFVSIAAYWDAARIVRRVSELAFLPPMGDLTIVARSEADCLNLDPRGLAVLGDWSALPVDELQSSIAERAAQLLV